MAAGTMTDAVRLAGVWGLIGGWPAAAVVLTLCVRVWCVMQVLQDKYEGFLSDKVQDDFAYYAETAFKT